MKNIKSICPFLSSTFVDFQEERGHLVKKIFPALNTLCQEKRTYFSPVYLRWGITSKERTSHKVNKYTQFEFEFNVFTSICTYGLNIHVTKMIFLIFRTCLDYIEKSAPFFICMLGQHRSPDSRPLPENQQELSEN